MSTRKEYGPVDGYERKLENVMARFKATDLKYNFDRFGAWVEFRYSGELYRFDHSVENAKAHKQKLQVGSDCFSQIVMSLEDLARMHERGIYDLKRWIVGMRFLPPPTDIADCFKHLGFTEVPSLEEIKERFRKLSQVHHPDKGGSIDSFNQLKRAAEQAMSILSNAS